MVRRRFSCGLLSAALSLASLCAQSNLATVTGIVTDPVGAAAPGVAVTIRHLDTNALRSVLTNEEGVFTIVNLNPGAYELTAMKEGFRAFRETGMVLETGQTLRADVTLEVGPMSQSVSVSAAVAALNTENGTIKGDVIVQEEIQDIPLNGRDFTESWTASTIVTFAEPRHSSVRISMRCRNSRWRSRATPPNMARWPAAS